MHGIITMKPTWNNNAIKTGKVYIIYIVLYYGKLYNAIYNRVRV